ncbi:MAG: MBL fold metallo-hydrolase [Anaerolineae bacterium]|nr:MBL fold metallo-hydrolase [Anaerolineae bacterium]
MQRYSTLAVPIIAAVLLLVGSAALLPAGSAQAVPSLVATFLDVGQGDAIWVQTPDGQDLLIDGGPRTDGRVRDYLLSRGCTDIELMVLTHPHADHVSGLVPVLEGMPVHEVWYNGQEYGSAIYARFLGLIAAEGIVSRTVRAGEAYTRGAVTLQILHPQTLRASEANNNSVVCRLSYGELDLLLTGDVEASAEGEMLGRRAPLEAEVLKVAHHGSDSSSTLAFLEAVSPEIAVISVGATNPYGHPSPATVARLRALGAAVHRTDWCGTLVLTSDGTSYTLAPPGCWLYLYLPLALHSAGPGP